jgi:hypothetical protein
MPAGTWPIRSTLTVGHHAANNGWGGGTRDFVRCWLLAGSTVIDGGATVEITAGSVIDDVVNARVYQSSTAWTLKESCSHDAIYTGGDGHWSTDSGDLRLISGGILG